MKLVPYLNFNGNCAEAIKFYEKVFNAEAESCLYEDMPKFDSSMPVPKGKEKWIMHSSMKLSNGVELQLSDCDEQGKNVGTNICLQLTYNTEEKVRAVFNALRNGGKVLCDIQKTFYATLYGELVDKFGIRWSIMQG